MIDTIRAGDIVTITSDIDLPDKSDSMIRRLKGWTVSMLDIMCNIALGKTMEVKRLETKSGSVISFCNGGGFAYPAWIIESVNGERYEHCWKNVYGLWEPEEALEIPENLSIKSLFDMPDK